MSYPDPVRRPQARAIAIAAPQVWPYRLTAAFLLAVNGAFWAGLGLLFKILF